MVADRLAQGQRGAGRGRHADDQHGGRAGAARARRARSCAPRSATATCSRSCCARGWQLGGEGSGHLLALDKHTTGDGIVSALQVLQAVVPQRAQRWPSCSPASTLFPQTLINVRLEPGADWTVEPRRWPTDAAEVDRELGGSGRVLIRPSGTEPVVRVMVEARDAAQSQALRRAARGSAGAERVRRQRGSGPASAVM